MKDKEVWIDIIRLKLENRMEEELSIGMENRNLDMRENWIKWNPLNMPEGNYMVTKFLQNIDGTEIALSNE